MTGASHRSTRRGVRRVRRDITVDPALDAVVADVAEQRHGGNYSAALCELAARGAIGEMDYAVAEVDRLTGPRP